MAKEGAVNVTDWNNKNKQKREKNNPPSKVVVRGLPPTMTQDTFVDQVSPLPENDYLYFVRGDLNLGQFAFSRAYINFLNQEDIFIFTEKFDGYVFVDQKGNEYSAVVEFAPFQKIPKRASRKKDAKCGTIDTDPDYLRFLEQREKTNDADIGPPSTQEVLEQIEAKERELRAHHGVLKMSTPLLDYIRQRKEEKARIREEKKEERRRREADRRKMREEERRRPREMSNYSRDSTKDKMKVDKSPKQLLTHKEKDSQGTDAEMTKRLKEALKISGSSEKSDKQKKDNSAGVEKDKGFVPDKEKLSFRERERYREREVHKDRQAKYKDRDHYGASKDKDKDLQRQDRERERAKRREEERARKHAARKPTSSEKHDKKEHESQESISPKMLKDEEATGEEKQKKQIQHNSKENQTEGTNKSSLLRGDVDKMPHDSKVTMPDKTVDEGQSDVSEVEKGKEEKRIDVSKDARNKSETSTKSKPERIRNKVGMELTEKGKIIKNKDRPSMQLYRPGMLKKRSSTGSTETSNTVVQLKEGEKSRADQESASTSSSSSPTPPTSNKKDKTESKRRSSAPPTKANLNIKEHYKDSKSDDDNVKEDVPVQSRTFKRSFS